MMVILPATLIAHTDPSQQANLSLPMSVVWSVMAHAAALVALVYWGLPTTSEQFAVNKDPLTLVEVSRSATAAAVQGVQIAPSLRQTKALSLAAVQTEAAKPFATTDLNSTTAHTPIASSIASFTASPIAWSAAPPISEQPDSAAKTAASASTVPRINAASQTTPVVLAPASASTSAAIPSSASVVAPAIELPSSSAAYLHNPPPVYPAQSRRLGEQGAVKWRVLIGVDGRASEPELVQSSGFERLDEAAKQAVLSWRYIPGKRSGVAQAMRYVVPLTFN